MIAVRRANVILEVEESQVERMLDSGFQLLDEYDSVKEMSIAEYKSLVDSLRNENEELKREIAKLTSNAEATEETHTRRKKSK